MEQLLSDEHLIAHLGSWNLYKVMRRNGLEVTILDSQKHNQHFGNLSKTGRKILGGCLESLTLL